MKTFYVYITASQRNGTLYIGVANDLNRRIYKHKNKIIKGFTEKYNVSLLVYYETFRSINDAIRREKQLKAWQRDWKIRLIETLNPKWKDLYLESLTEEDFKQ